MMEFNRLNQQASTIIADKTELEQRCLAVLRDLSWRASHMPVVFSFERGDGMLVRVSGQSVVLSIEDVKSVRDWLTFMLSEVEEPVKEESVPSAPEFVTPISDMF
jgi:uncharacterized Fe-S cluster-containing protein